MAREQWEQEAYDRGYAQGSEPQSAAKEAAEIIGRVIQSQAYVDGYNQAQEDRAKN